MKKILIMCLALALAALFTAPTATAQKFAETFNCSYDAVNKEIDYAVSGGDVGQTYEIVYSAVGRIQFTEACPNLTGPSDSDNCSITCNGQGRGTATAVFKKNTVEVARFDFCFNNDSLSNIKQVPCYAGPTMTEWGLIVFAGLFVALLIFVIRKRARVPTAA